MAEEKQFDMKPKKRSTYIQFDAAEESEGQGGQGKYYKFSKCKQQFYIWFLFFNHISAQWQTYLFAYLKSGKDPETNMKIGLGLSDQEYALVNGTLFTIINSGFGLLLGIMADKYNRKMMLFICAILWTSFSLTCAFTNNFLQIVFPRMMFSLFMAACIPTSVSLIADYFEHEQRGRANSLFAFGIYLGVAMSSLTVLVDKSFGWRWSIIIVSIVCYAIAIPVLFFQEPPRKSSKSIILQFANASHTNFTKEEDDGEIEQSERLHHRLAQISLGKKLKNIMTNKCFIFLLIAIFLRFFGGFSMGFMSASFFQQKYPDDEEMFSVLNAVVIVGGGLPASFIGGFLGDAYESKYPKVKCYISAFGALAAVPFVLITFYVQPQFYLGMASLYVEYLLAEMWYGPAHAIVNKIFPSEFQGVAIAIFTLVGSLSGALATWLLGLLGEIYDVDNKPEVMGYLIAIFVSASYISCAPFFCLTSNEYAKVLKHKSLILEQHSNQNSQ